MGPLHHNLIGIFFRWLLSWMQKRLQETVDFFLSGRQVQDDLGCGSATNAFFHFRQVAFGVP